MKRAISVHSRFIWTVIGNTVNLAARLQSMTRELNAAVAIDDTTFHRAGRETCAWFWWRSPIPAVIGRFRHLFKRPLLWHSS